MSRDYAVIRFTPSLLPETDCPKCEGKLYAWIFYHLGRPFYGKACMRCYHRVWTNKERNLCHLVDAVVKSVLDGTCEEKSIKSQVYL